MRTLVKIMLAAALNNIQTMFKVNEQCLFKIKKFWLIINQSQYYDTKSVFKCGSFEESFQNLFWFSGFHQFNHNNCSFEATVFDHILVSVCV